MKKLISGILAILMIASMTFGAFAAPSVGKVVGVSTTNGDYIFYIFGENASENATEVGLTIEGRPEDYKLRYFPKDEEDSLQKYLECGKYGIGIKDAKNLLGDTFKAAPYEIVNGEKIVGDYVTISKSEAETADYVGLTKLFINGKAAPGFHTETGETDFYYGLETLPATAEELPAIEIASTHGTLVKGEVEKYYGGYTVPYSVEYTNVNGNVLDKTFNIHFREFTDKVVTVAPTSAYRVHNSYFDHSQVGMMNLKEQTESINIALNTASNTPSNQDTYIYFTYDVEEIEGYAPVGYDLTGLRARYNPFDIYSYDGDLSNVIFPRTAEDALENAGMFAGFKGYNPVSQFHLYGNDITPEGNEYIVDEPGVVASTTSVTEGNNILIYRSRYPKTGTYPAYIYYRGDMPNYQMKINVKYVEKNPVDITASDATLKTVTINGKAADGLDEANSIWYAGVDSFDNFDFASASVNAVANVEGAVVTYGTYNSKIKELPITVTAKDGVTKKEYTLRFKEMQYTKINWSNLPYLHHDGTKYHTGKYNGNANMLGRRGGENWESNNTTITYAEFSTAGLENIILAGTSYLNAVPGRNTTYLLYNTTYESISATNKFDEIRDGKADLLATFECKAGDGTAGVARKIAIDSSLLKPKANGNIYIGLIVPVGAAVGYLNQVSATEPINLELGYIVMEPNSNPDETDVSLATVQVDGKDAEAYDEATATWYAGIESFETFDYASVMVDAVVNAEGASVYYGEYDEKLRQLPITVTSKNGTVSKDYTIIFKEYVKTEIAPAGYAYQIANEVGGLTHMQAMSENNPLSTAAGSKDYVGYVQFNTSSLGKIALAGESVLKGNVGSQGTYDFYNSIHNTYKVKDGFAEFNEGKAKLLGTLNIDGVSYNAEKTLAINAEDINVTDEGNIVIALIERYDDYNDTIAFKNVSLNLSYIVMEPNPEYQDPGDKDVSIKSVTVNGEETLYYDDVSKTFYFGVESFETFDFDNCEIEVVPTVDGADGNGFGDSSSNSAVIEVISRDGSVTGEYTLVFKEIQHTTLNWTNLSYLDYNGSRYSSGNYNAKGYMLGRRGGENWETANTTITYAEFPTTELGNIVVAGKSKFNATPSRNTSYLLYNTTYETISASNKFDEIRDGKADLLGSFECVANDGTVNVARSIEIDSSLIKPKTNGNIYIGLSVPAGAAVGYLNYKAKATDPDPAPITLELGYIVID